MRMTKDRIQTKQTPLDRSVQNAGKHPQQAEADPAAWPELPQTARLRDAKRHPERKTLDLTTSSGYFDIKQKGYRRVGECRLIFREMGSWHA